MTHVKILTAAEVAVVRGRCKKHAGDLVVHDYLFENQAERLEAARVVFRRAVFDALRMELQGAAELVDRFFCTDLAGECIEALDPDYEDKKEAERDFADFVAAMKRRRMEAIEAHKKEMTKRKAASRAKAIEDLKNEMRRQREP